VKNNRGILTLLNKWYKVLTENNEINIVSAMKEKQLIKSTPVIADLCSQCKKDTKPKTKKKPAKKRKAKKKIAVEEEKTTIVVGKKKAAALEDSTLLQLKAIDIEERIANAKKQKIALKDIIIMFLEDKAQSTKDRQVNEIARALDVESTQVHDIIRQLVQDNTVQKEYPLFDDYYILTKDYNAEITRKYLEIQNYFKIRADNQFCCTQASVSLEFELPFSVVGVLLNNMINNRLITKETTEIIKDGKQRKIRFYSSTTY
jgi:DNA-binding Lrp family transcriptional regulator